MSVQRIDKSVRCSIYFVLPPFVVAARVLASEEGVVAMDVVILVRLSHVIVTTSGSNVDHVVRKHVVQGTLSVSVVIVVLDYMVGNEAIDCQCFRSVKRTRTFFFLVAMQHKYECGFLRKLLRINSTLVMSFYVQLQKVVPGYKPHITFTSIMSEIFSR